MKQPFYQKRVKREGENFDTENKIYDFWTIDKK